MGKLSADSVRGDDVNAGGLGDQQDYAETDQVQLQQRLLDV
jgi:hypothetical protein